MLKAKVFTLLLIIPFLASAQKYMPKGGKYGGNKSKYRTNSSQLKRNPTDVFPLDPEFRLDGFYAALGGTYMLPMRGGSGTTYSMSQFNDSILETNGQYNSTPSGKFGIYAELGWFHSFHNNAYLHFMDFGISYRQYKGGESFRGSYTTTLSDTSNNSFDGPTTFVQSDETYSDQIVSATISVTNHYHFSRYGFVQNSLGANVDYFFSTFRSAGPAFPGVETEFPSEIQAQLHYRLGVGWKASPTILVIPSVTLPILTAYPFDDFKSSLPYFTSRHYPIVFSIRVMFLRRIGEDCNVPNYDGPSSFQ